MKISDLSSDGDRVVLFFKELKNACKSLKCDVRSYGNVDGYPFIRLTINPEIEPTLLITSGIHGNEPCGPLGIIEWLKENNIPTDLRIIIVPLINPTGFKNDIRRNGDNVDLNRGFNRSKRPAEELELFKMSMEDEKVDLLLSLHEDHGHDGIYMYYADVDESECKSMLQSLSKIIPIVKNKTVYGDTVEDGMIYITLKNEDPKHAYSLENAVQSLGVAQITFETPVNNEAKLRTLAHKSIISMVIDKFNDIMK